MARTNVDIIQEACGDNVVAGEFMHMGMDGYEVVAVWKDGEVLLTDAGRELVQKVRATEEAAAIAETTKA